MNYLDMARTMLMVGTGEDDLPKDLKDRLNKADYFVQIAGGELRSRQIVAVIVQQWIWDNPKEAKKFARGKDERKQS